MIYRAEYLKPDGRRLWLYGRSPPKITAPTSPDPNPLWSMPISAAIRF